MIFLRPGVKGTFSGAFQKPYPKLCWGLAYQYCPRGRTAHLRQPFPSSCSFSLGSLALAQLPSMHILRQIPCQDQLENNHRRADISFLKNKAGSPFCGQCHHSFLDGMPQTKLVISEANYTKTLLYNLSFNGGKKKGREVDQTFPIKEYQSWDLSSEFAIMSSDPQQWFLECNNRGHLAQ